MRNFYILLCLSLLFITSCVNKEYDIDNLNTEVTIASSGLALPLGETEYIRIKDFLKGENGDFLQRDPDGSFSISFADSLSLSEDINGVFSIPSIPGVSLSYPFDFKLEDTFSLNDDLVFDQISITESFPAGITSMRPSASDLALDIAPLDYSMNNVFDKVPAISFLLMGGEEVEIPASLLPAKEIDPLSSSIDIDITLPEGINEIKEISLNPNAKVKCEISIEDPFIKRGTITPNINIDLSELLEIEGANLPLNLSSLQLSEANSYSASRQFDVTAFNIAPSEWDGRSLKVTKNIEVSGDVSLSDVATDKATYDGSDNMRLKVMISYIDLTIDNVRVGIDPITLEDGVNIDLDIPEIELPSDISKIGKLTLSSDSKTSLTLGIKNPVKGLALGIKSMILAFPASIEVEGADAQGRLTFSNVDLATPFSKDIVIKSIQMPDPVDGKVNFSEVITTSFVFEGSGEISIKDLPTLPSEDLTVEVNVTTNLKVEDCQIDMNSFVMDLPAQKNSFTVLQAGTLPKELLEISNIDIKRVPLDLVIKASGIPNFGEGKNIQLDIKVDFGGIIEPKEFAIKGEISNTQDLERRFEITDIDLSGVDFSNGADVAVDVNISGSIKVEDPSITISDVLGADVHFDVVGALGDIEITKLEGKVNYNIDGIQQSVTLDNLPDLLKGEGVCLDIDNPRIELRFKTNIGIPVKGELSLVAYRDDAESGKPIKLDIQLPYSENSSVTKESVIWIGNKEEGVPADVTFYKADIASLIKNIPDKIDVSIAAKTDDQTTSVIEAGVDYLMDLKYEFYIPLSFGEEFNISLSTDMDVSQMNIGSLLKYGKLVLDGKIKSTLPLEFNMDLIFLDGEDNVIPMDPISQRISPCNRDGSEAETPLYVMLSPKPGADIEKITKIKLDFKVTSGNVSGVPITEESYLKAILSLEIPEGITLDVREL